MVQGRETVIEIEDKADDIALAISAIRRLCISGKLQQKDTQDLFRNCTELSGAFKKMEATISSLKSKYIK